MLMSVTNLQRSSLAQQSQILPPGGLDARSQALVNGSSDCGTSHTRGWGEQLEEQYEGEGFAVGN